MTEQYQKPGSEEGGVGERGTQMFEEASRRYEQFKMELSAKGIKHDGFRDQDAPNFIDPDEQTP